MRRSSYRHPIAVLRTVLDLSTEEFAALVGCSKSTVESIEAGPRRLKLSDALAMAISEATGVSLVWLLQGNPKVPIIDRLGAPYTKAQFTQMRATFEAGPAKIPLSSWLRAGVIQLAQLLDRAETAGVCQLVLYRVLRSFDEIAMQLELPPKERPSWDQVERMLGNSDANPALGELLAKICHTKGLVDKLNAGRAELQKAAREGDVAKPSSFAAHPSHAKGQKNAKASRTAPSRLKSEPRGSGRKTTRTNR